MALSVAQAVGSRMAKLTKDVGAARKTAVERAAFGAKKEIVQEVRQASGDLRLSGVGRSGARVNVGYDIKGGADNPVALVKARGPLHLVENPVKPHDITPKARRRGGKRAVVTPFGPKAKVRHPGVRSPKKPWAKGKRRAEPIIKREVAAVFSKAFARGATR